LLGLLSYCSADRSQLDTISLRVQLQATQNSYKPTILPNHASIIQAGHSPSAGAALGDASHPLLARHRHLRPLPPASSTFAPASPPDMNKVIRSIPPTRGPLPLRNMFAPAETRKVVIVGHDLANDLQSLHQIGVDVGITGSVFGTIDTPDVAYKLGFEHCKPKPNRLVVIGVPADNR